jgi:hypothetical protein
MKKQKCPICKKKDPPHMEKLASLKTKKKSEISKFHSLYDYEII